MPAKKSAPKPRPKYRRADTGEYTTKKYADKHKKTTVRSLSSASIRVTAAARGVNSKAAALFPSPRTSDAESPRHTRRRPRGGRCPRRRSLRARSGRTDPSSAGRTLARVNELLDEARQMPNASVRFARGIDQVWTPEHLIPLRTRVRSEHSAELLAVHAEINKRFGTTGASDDYVNVFYAASEMALMERVAREELPTEDRVALRRLWGDLLSAA